MPPASHASSVTPGSQAQPADFNQNQTIATTLFISIGQTMTKIDKDIHYLGIFTSYPFVTEGISSSYQQKKE